MNQTHIPQIINDTSMIQEIERGLLFVVFYGLVDYIEEIVNEFESVCSSDQEFESRYKYSVHWYPYLKYVNDLMMNTEQMHKHLIQVIKEKHITHIFWLFLPENASFYDAIRRDVPEIKFIFYNFEDLKNFNLGNLKIAEHMDYFIQPTQINQQKYSLVLKNNVFYVPHYVHVDIVCLQTMDQLTHEIKEQSGVDPDIDCTVIVEDSYDRCDVVERRALSRYLQNIKLAMMDANLTFKVYGDPSLENVFPDIYEDELDIMSEGIRYANTKCVVILDVADGVDKSFGKKIIHASLNNKKIFTNSFGINSYVRRFIPESDSQILCMDKMKPLIQYIQEKKTDTMNQQDMVQDTALSRQFAKDRKIHDIRSWVHNILHLIS